MIATQTEERRMAVTVAESRRAIHGRRRTNGSRSPRSLIGGNRRVLEKEVTNYLQNPASSPYSAEFKVRKRSAIIDWNTKNKSFLEVHKQLKLLGIKNNAFFLTLLNPDLQGVDPHDPNITPLQAIQVVEECQLNVFYYLREVVRIPAQGAKTVPFKLDRATLAAIYCFYNDTNFYLNKPRQTGKTVAICALMSWAFKFGVSNGEFMFSANTSENVKRNLKKMKDYIRLLPSYMSKMGTQAINDMGKVERKRDNITTYSEPLNGNTAKCAKCAISREAAEEIGRGESHVFEFFDEAEFTPYIDVIVGVTGMSFNTAAANARRNGGHACRMFATTPGDLADEKKCKRAMILVNDAVVWNEQFYDQGINKLREVLYEKSKYRIVYIEYDYKSLGYGEAWFQEACANVGFNLQKIRREILLQRFTGNSQSPFNPDDITELTENVKKPVWIDKIDALNEIHFYQVKDEIKSNRMHFIALDPSDGTGGDYYGMVILDPYTLQTVAEFKNNYMTPQGCRELMEYIVRKYFHNVIIVIENNRNGHTLIHFFDDSFLKPRIYAAAVADQDTNLVRDQYDEKGFLKEQIMRNKYYGVRTTPTSRDMMMNILVDTVNFRKDLLCTKYLVQDICDLVIKAGKIQADVGKHDDMVMAWCLAMYVYYYGEKLERYGFKKGELPEDIVISDDFMKLRELYNNPYIKQNFPTMAALYENEMKAKLEKEHREEVAKIHRSVIKNDIGSIKKSLERHDPDYHEVMGNGVVGNSGVNEEWKSNIVSKWKMLNNRSRK